MTLCFRQPGGHVSGQVDAVRGLSQSHLGSGFPGTTLAA